MDDGYAYRYYLGCRGWEDAPWEAAFYPADLPPDWRLSYYGYFFTCVYLSYAQWGLREMTVLDRWVAEDTYPAFRFVLEGNPRGESAEDRKRMERLAPRLGVVIGAEDGGERLLRLTGPVDVAALARRLQALPESAAPLFLIGDDPAQLDPVHHLLEALGG
ncbi:MAG TPA: hypothetical protein DEP05_04805 [Betaproteobacteria bacterium]|nr:hypothetical protein [Betaproteobacteria bacterium]